jgi:hypothetical protein
VVLLAIGLSLFFYYLPPLASLDRGLGVSISAVAASLVGAALFPISDGKGDGRDE